MSGFQRPLHLHGPNLGALTHIAQKYKPIDTPVGVKDIVTDLVISVCGTSHTGSALDQPGDSAVHRELCLPLVNYSIPLTGPQ